MLSQVYDIDLIEDRKILDVQSEQKGPLIIVFGGIHGNEHAGLKAMQAVQAAFDQGIAKLKAGRVVGMAGNLPALKRGLRYQDFDMNRIWIKNHVENLKQHGEAAIRCKEDHELLALIRDVQAIEQNHDQQYERIFIDLHSFSAPGGLFSITMPSEKHASLAGVLKAPMIFGVIEHLNGTALHYFDRQGYCSIGFEGGQHVHQETPRTMESALWLLMQHRGMIDEVKEAFLAEKRNYLHQKTQGLPDKVQLMYRHSVYENANFVMRPGFQNFDPIYAGQELADDRFGPVKAPCDGFMLMPLYQSQGEDGFFIVAEA